MLSARRPWLMGVVNVTPDSFSDGGKFEGTAAAIAHGVALWRAGAQVLDIGGEATNPWATTVTAELEAARVLPVLRGLAAATDALLSIDTTKAWVAAAALEAGAEIVNDISGGRFDETIWQVTDRAGAAYICGHLRGRTLAEVFVDEQHITVDEVTEELRQQLARLPIALRARTVIDPGLGFGKGCADDNWALLDGAGQLSRALAAQVLVGPSRKRFVRAGLKANVSTANLDRATAVACVRAVAAGAHGLRIHDIAGVVAALATAGQRSIA